MESLPFPPDYYASFACTIAKKAGALIKNMQQEAMKGSRLKGARDVLTDADLASEKLIIGAIKEQFPNHEILSEESVTSVNFQAPLWIIDPIDGTHNYSRGHHHSAVCIAFSYKGIVQAGVVYNPWSDECFRAARGTGAFLNNEKITPRHAQTLEECLVATGFPATRREEGKAMAARVFKIITECHDLRRIGAASLDTCWVACGKLDAYYESVKPWDIAAAGLIAREAGCFVGHFIPPTETIPVELDGKNFFVSSPLVAEELCSLLASAT